MSDTSAKTNLSEAFGKMVAKQQPAPPTKSSGMTSQVKATTFKRPNPGAAKKPNILTQLKDQRSDAAADRRDVQALKRQVEDLTELLGDLTAEEYDEIAIPPYTTYSSPRGATADRFTTKVTISFQQSYIDFKMNRFELDHDILDEMSTSYEGSGGDSTVPGIFATMSTTDDERVLTTLTIPGSPEFEFSEVALYEPGTHPLSIFFYVLSMISATQPIVNSRTLNKL